MLMKGSKIKMVKRVPGFSLETGTVFTVDDIAEGMTIQFSCSMGAGIMSWDEFNRYFEEFYEESKPKEEWSEWQYVGDFYYGLFDTLCDDEVVIYCRQKGRMFQVKLMYDSGTGIIEDGISVKATAKCSPYDEYDFRKGYYLALSRAMDKLSKEMIG